MLCLEVSVSGSIVVKLALGRRLRAARAEARKTVADVTTAGLGSKAKLARIESGLVPVKVADVRALCWLYGLNEVETEALAEMALNTATEGWWEDYSDVLPVWFSMYVELEAAANQVLSYDPELVLGLLQTSDYTRAIGMADPRLSAEAVERNVKLRSDRQQGAFTRQPPLEVTAVLGAGVLHRQVGGQQVMDSQRQALRERSAQRNVDVRILPWGVGAHAAMQGAFVILQFARPDHPDVVYLETRAGGRYIHKDEVVADYHRMFAIIREESNPIEEHP